MPKKHITTYNKSLSYHSTEPLDWCAHGHSYPTSWNIVWSKEHFSSHHQNHILPIHLICTAYNWSSPHYDDVCRALFTHPIFFSSCIKLFVYKYSSLWLLNAYHIIMMTYAELYLPILSSPPLIQCSTPSMFVLHFAWFIAYTQTCVSSFYTSIQHISLVL